MAATTPKLATKAASETRFPTWEELVAEANEDAAQVDPYQIPIGENDVIIVPFPDGPRYMEILQGQRYRDAKMIIENLIPDAHDRARIIAKMRGVHFNIIDVLSSKILRHYYGLGVTSEAAEGNSPAS